MLLKEIGEVSVFFGPFLRVVVRVLDPPPVVGECRSLAKLSIATGVSGVRHGW